MIEILFFRGQMSYRMNILLIKKYFILYVWHWSLLYTR
jgi:hypothetical protein